MQTYKDRMRAASLWQPYAQLSVLGLKHIETRGWYTKHRGPLAMQATKARPKELNGIEYRGEFWEAFMPYFIEMPPWTIGNLGQKGALPMGAIVGTVNIVDCVPIESLYGSAYDTPRERAFGDWSEGRFGWIMESPVVFDKPVPIAGKQGLWNWDRTVGDSNG